MSTILSHVYLIKLPLEKLIGYNTAEEKSINNHPACTENLESMKKTWETRIYIYINICVCVF